MRRLLAGGCPGSPDVQVTVLDNLTYAGKIANLPDEHPRLKFVKGDVCDQDLLFGLLPEHDAVVHFAAESHVDRSLVGAADFVRTNVLGTQNLLDSCVRVGVGMVVHVSTDEVYGSIERGTWTESEPLQPNSPYAASKAGSDLIARAFHQTYGLDVRITRCSNNYGPYQHVEKMIPLFVTNLLSGYAVPLYGDGENVREWVHVDDHCQAIDRVLTYGEPGSIYNVGGGTILSNLELTARLLELCDAGWDRVRRVSDRKGHDMRYAIDDSKIRQELGWKPLWSFDDGLSKVVEWYRDHPEWWRTLQR